MINKKESFRHMLRAKYPACKRITLDELNAFIISRPLNTEDALLYHQAELQNGKFIVFYGLTAEQALDNIDKARREGPALLKGTKHKALSMAPTTWQNFENWLEKKGIRYTARVYRSRSSVAQLLRCEIKNCVDTEVLRNWYMYEFQPPFTGYESALSQTPYCIDNGVLYVLAKAPQSVYSYKSKKARALETFELVKPLEEQIISCLSTGQDEEALRLYNAYQQELTHTEDEYIVDLGLLREAIKNGTYHLVMISGKGRVKKAEYVDPFDV